MEEKSKNDYIEVIDETPEDLTFVVSNENGGFVIFESKKDKRMYGVYKVDSKFGTSMRLQMLDIPIDYNMQIQLQKQTKKEA